MRAKMSNARRAKQFMPFDALEGLQAALRRVEKEREQEIVVKPELAEDQAEIIDRKLRELISGGKVAVEVFEDGVRLTVSGEVGFIDGELIVIDGQEIAVDDLLGVF